MNDAVKVARKALSDDEILDLAVRAGLGRMLQPIAPANPPAFVTELGYKTGEVLDFARAAIAAADAELAREPVAVPFRGPCTIKARGGRCMCEAEGLGPECVHRDPLIDGYPLTAGLPPPAAQQGDA